MTQQYPHTRVEECSWQPEEVARHLAALASTATGGTANDTSSGNYAVTHLLSHGWSSRQVPLLRRAFGANIMSGDSTDEFEDDANQQQRRSIFRRLSPILSPIFSSITEQLKEPLILMLLFSAGISILLGNASDAVSIGIALFIVSLVAAVQEVRSEQALEKLASLVPHTCTVLRDGRVQDDFPAKELVVGDLILLATGDRVPADCRVVDSVELMLDESNLTGENHAVHKTGEGLTLFGSTGSSMSTTSRITIPQQTNIAFCGTLVNAGRGRALVVAVGKSTEFGMVASELNSIESRKSPLQVKIDDLGKKLAYLSSAAIALLAIWGLLMGRPFLETLTVAVSLAVAAIPEGLPICTTVTLALGVLRMSKRNAIVKKLPVVESLGCATAICSDKTGTLTQNEMTARAAFTLAFPHTRFRFTGVGYKSFSSNSGNRFKLMIASDSIDHSENDHQPQSPTMASQRSFDANCPENVALTALLTTGCLCNNASLPTVTSTMDIHSGSAGNAGNHGSIPGSGQPTELALLVAAEKAGVMDPRPQYHRLQEVPFTSDRKMMEVRARPVSGLHACQAFTMALTTQMSATQRRRSSTDGSIYFVKGMPEKILAECQSHVAPDGSAVPLTEDGRTMVLSQSRRMAAGGLRILAMAYGDDLDRLTFAGIIGIEDPPREGVQDSVHSLQRGGVKVMMLTGDSKETALAIARRCGILDDESKPIRKTYSDDPGGRTLRNRDIGVLSSDVGSADAIYDGKLTDVELGASVALSGAELDSIPPQTLADSIVGVRVFYRVAPRHKLAIVRALQKHGDIVAMTGDGKYNVLLRLCRP